jgi:hypothetical protein
MRTHKKTLVLLFLAVAATQSASAAPSGAPDFSGKGDVGWIAVGDMFMPPDTGPGPVRDDPAHPRISNALAAATGKQASFHMGDVNSPVLQPWAKEALRQRNAAILAGKPGYTRAVSCWPLGVPAFLLGFVQPIFFIQTPKEVLLTWQEGHEARHIYMNVPHGHDVKPSWFGESVGHYEGDTLVVDTIGMNDKTYIDHFRTPHSDKLHVIERFRVIDGGKTLETRIHVEDPGAFTTAWNAVQHHRKVEDGPMLEVDCAENNNGFFSQDVEPMPIAAKPDF